MRISALDPVIVAWILGRARAMPGGRPAFTYPAIARNLWKSRRVRLSGWAVKRLVTREDPDLARRRAAWEKRRREKSRWATHWRDEFRVIESRLTRMAPRR